ncbi:MAG: protein kinase [Elusimicrobiota bacterium]
MKRSLSRLFSPFLAALLLAPQLTAQAGGSTPLLAILTGINQQVQKAVIEDEREKDLSSPKVSVEVGAEATGEIGVEGVGHKAVQRGVTDAVQSVGAAVSEEAAEFAAAVQKISEQVLAAKTEEEQVQILSQEAPVFETLFTRPPPEGVPPETYDRISNEVADLCNRLENYRCGHGVSRRILDRQRDGGENAKRPVVRDALNNLAGAQLGMGRFKEAAQSATRVTRAHENDERAYTTRALAYYQMGNYVQALEDSKRALALNANNESAFQISKLSAGRITKPDDLSLDAKQRAAAEKISREYEAMVQQRNQIEAAQKAAPPVELRAEAPSDPSDRIVDSLARQASNKIKLGDYHGAIQITDRALARSPNHVEARYMRAAAENMTGNYPEAVAHATKVLSMDPRHAPALDARAAAYLQLGRHHEALADADRALAIDQKDAYALRNRARAKENLGDLAGMIADYRQAAELNPQFQDELRELAEKYAFSLAAGGAEASRPAPAEPGRNRRFFVVLVSSLSGGLLIAIGLLHIVTGGRGGRTLLSKLTGGGEPAGALAAGPGLEAGFQVLRTLGNGGMGVVYEATDKALGRKVAIKKMREEIQLDKRERAHFLQEARIVAGLHHPNIVDIHSILEDGGNLYLVFEYVEGRTIDELLASRKRLGLKEAQYVLRGVCNALEYAHKKGVVHRDLKPSNIMVDKDGIVKVMDFGIARQAKDALAKSTQTRTVAGTPQYMAPEQEEGVVRKESDVFSLGACLYEMATGQRPYPAPSTTGSKLNKRYARPSRVTSGLPEELDSLIDDALEPDPEQRIHSVAEFRARLDAIKVPSQPQA